MHFTHIKTPKHPSLWQRYSAAVVAVLCAVLCKLLFEALVGLEALLLIFVLPVVFSAWYGGFGPGLAATGLSVLAGIAFRLAGTPTTNLTEQLPSLVLFVLAGVGISWLNVHYRHIQDALRQSHNSLLDVADSIGNGFFAVDDQWRLLYANKHFERVTHRQREDLIGKSLWEEFPQVIDTPLYQRYQEAMASRTPLHLEYFSTFFNLWLEIHAYPFQNGLAVYFQDIAERKRIEEQMCFQANALAQVKDVVLALDTHQQITYVNKEAERFFQVQSDAAIGCSASDIYQYRWFHASDEHAATRALSTTGSWSGEAMVVVGGHDMYAEMSVNMLHDDHDAEIGQLVIIRDITQRKQSEAERFQLLNREKTARVRAELAQQRLAFLAEASRELAISLDYTTTLDSLARLTVPALADWCVVDVVDDTGQISRVALAHANPEKEVLLHTLRHGTQPHEQAPSLHAQVFSSGESVLITEVDTAELINYMPDVCDEDILSQLGLHSLMIVPLMARGLTVGTITLVCGESNCSYSSSDLTLAEDLAHRAALAVDNARLYRDAQMSRAEANALAGRSTFLAEVSRILATSLEYKFTLTEVAHLAVPFLADWCLIDLVDEHGQAQRIEARSSNMPRDDAGHPIRQTSVFAIEQSPAVSKVLQTGRPEFYPELPATARNLFAYELAQLEPAQHPTLQSAIVVPLLARRHTLGAISCISLSPERRYHLADLTLVEDLAQRVALALDNAHLYKEVQEAVHVRDQFLSIASHELKTPLTSLLGYSRLLQNLAQSGNLTEREQRGIRIIGEQANRLSKLINALLDISRIRTGRLSIEQKAVDLTMLARRVVEEVQVVLDQHMISISDPDVALVVQGDILRLEQVLQNLIQNAIKYSPDGDDIHVQIEQQDQWACIKVIDQGIGIPAASIPQMFQPFYRAPNTETQQIAGMGIGLYVVREIVNLHSGEVDVISQEGEGSTFIIRLPLVSVGETVSLSSLSPS
jgi:PAS domain S-box-containing protein